jgi:hypothetical protein
VLNLKTYDGSYKEWLNFENSFKSVIGENKNLNKCQRLQYLKSVLRNEALRAIESLPITDENYTIAWEALEKRFKNTRLIVEDHVLAILNAAPILKTSSTMLRELLDTVNTNMAALESLNIPVASWDAVIVLIIFQKLDYSTKREWQMTLDNSIPTYKKLIQFLEKRCTVLEALNATSSDKQNNAKTNHQQTGKPRTLTHAGVNKKLLCTFCKNSEHHIGQCGNFLELNAPDRNTQAKRLNLCTNCLGDNHKVANCFSNSKCRTCKGKHHTLLHLTQPGQQNDEAITTNNHTLPVKNVTESVLLSTAVILIKNRKNQYVPCRAFLDTGSMSNYITEKLHKKLGLNASPVNFTIKCLNGTTNTAKREISVNLKSRINEYSMDLKCLVIPKITENLPLKTISPSFLEIPKNISLADPKFFESSQVDLLIGAGSFWKLLCIGQVISPRGLTFQKTHFGFIAGGTFGNPEFNKTTTCNLAATIKPETNLEKQVQNFWNMKEIPSIVGDTEKLSVEEIACERHFQENTIRDSEGRFVIRLPFKNNNLTIGDTKNASLKWFYGIERKLCNDPEMKIKYSNFMSEYLDLNHTEESKIANKNECVYLPHHAVVKESSTTTKLRVVFDGSLKSFNGFSLNDNLMCGPVIQPDLFTIVVNFRTYQFVLSGDLTKMYRSVRLHPDDFKHQQIFWRSDPNEPLKSFSLTTLTYGLKPSSFIATRCLQELSNRNNESFPRESEIIRKHFYMDDLLTGSNTASELIGIKNNLVSILNQAKFELRKLQSNEPKVLPVNKSEICDPNVPLNNNENTKTLGLYWNSTTDTVKYEIKLQNISKKITKRTILSLTAQIFDPLGLVSPIIMKAKIIIQKLWSLKLGWDESIPMDLHTLWNKFTYQLNLLHQLTIPRKVITFFPHELIEFHGFSDASQQGYGAAVYVRVKSTENTYETHLLCAKSRVAPLKTITLPRLELCGALLLARLFEKVKQSVNLHNAREIFWTDSSIVLA